VVVGNVCRPNNRKRAPPSTAASRTRTSPGARALRARRISPLVVAGTTARPPPRRIAAWLLDRTGFEPAS
jgi:hypothetical protein